MIEERRARQEPADRLLRDGKRVHRGDEPIDEADERFAVGDVAGAIDQRVLPSDQIERHERAEIARVHRHALPDFGRQLGRRADEHRDVVTGGERLAQHVATEDPVAPRMRTRDIRTSGVTSPIFQAVGLVTAPPPATAGRRARRAAVRRGRASSRSATSRSRRSPGRRRARGRTT